MSRNRYEGNPMSLEEMGNLPFDQRPYNGEPTAHAEAQERVDSLIFTAKTTKGRASLNREQVEEQPKASEARDADGRTIVFMPAPIHRGLTADEAFNAALGLEESARSCEGPASRAMEHRVTTLLEYAAWMEKS